MDYGKVLSETVSYSETGLGRITDKAELDVSGKYVLPLHGLFCHYQLSNLEVIDKEKFIKSNAGKLAQVLLYLFKDHNFMLNHVQLMTDEFILLDTVSETVVTVDNARKLFITVNTSSKNVFDIGENTRIIYDLEYLNQIRRFKVNFVDGNNCDSEVIYNKKINNLLGVCGLKLKSYDPVGSLFYTGLCDEILQ